MRYPVFDNGDQKPIAPTFTSPHAPAAGMQRRAIAALIGWTASAAIACFALRAIVLADVRPGEKLHIFWHLYLRDEPAAAALGLAIVLGAVFLTRLAWSSRLDDAVERLAARPWPFIALATAALAVAAVIVYRRHPLSMDEYAPLFQARAFARGSWWGEVPPAVLPRLVPIRSGHFLEASADGRVISSYWPGFALLLAPFAALGVPWLLNPLLGGATLFIVWRLAGKLLPSRAAPGWALLLTAASPAFAVEAISYYSMAAHLLFNLLFVSLLLEPTPRRLFAAGAVGSFALVLHNPVPHLLFALPWIAWIALRHGARRLAALSLGYLPLSAVLGLGWAWIRSRIAGSGAQGPGIGEFATGLARAAFTMPGADVFLARAAGVLELILWAVPGLLLAACWGGWRSRRGGDRAMLLLAASGACTIAG